MRLPAAALVGLAVIAVFGGRVLWIYETTEVLGIVLVPKRSCSFGSQVVIEAMVARGLGVAVKARRLLRRPVPLSIRGTVHGCSLRQLALSSRIDSLQLVGELGLAQLSFASPEWLAAIFMSV